MPPLYGFNCHLPLADQLDRVRACGLAVVRVDFNWAFIEPSRGDFRWDQTDTLVDEASARGLWLYPTLAHPPPWAGINGGLNDLPRSADDWYGFVASVVRRYHPRITAWSLWNEPNAGPITPEQYVQVILMPGAAAIRTYGPGSLVCGPELMTEHSWPTWLRRCLQLGGASFDAISVHNYASDGRAVVRNLFGGGWSWPWSDPPVIKIVQETGQAAKPLLLTETGWNTAEVTEAQQASYYDQLMEALERRSSPASVLGYHFRDEQPRDWGIVHEDLSPKPAFYTIQRRLGVPVG